MQKWKMRRAAVALIAAVGLTLSACGTTDSSGGSGTSGGAGDACGLKIGFFGALTGDAAALGVNIQNGVQLAIDEYNEANADCTVELASFDSQGSETQAPALATQAINDQAVIGIVGPAFSGESKAADPAFAEAGLPTITPSATNPALADNGWDTFHRMLGNDATQGPAAAKYIQNTLQATSVFVVDDASEYGKGLADIVKSTLGSAVVDSDTIQQKQTDFAATVTKVKASNATALFFGGYYAEAGLLIKQLRAGGWTGTFVVADGVKDPEYVKLAGADAEGTVITCPCIPPTDPKVAEFATAYQAKFNTEAGTYSAEAYDSTNVFLAGLKDGATTRADMLAFVNAYDAPGVTKQIKFDEKGEVSEVPIFAYKVEGGQIVALEEIK